MRYGVCNWIFGDEDLTSTAAFLAESGFDGVELKGDLHLYRPEEAKTVLDDHFLFHTADSNRQAVGRGHTDFVGLMRALQRIGYAGDVIIECTVAGPDPFTPVKGNGWLAEVRRYTKESL